MEIKKEFDVTLKLIIEVIHYTPARPAPPCSNPDSPAFSDPGDDFEMEFNLFLVSESGEKIELPKVLHYLYEELFEEIVEIYEDQLEIDQGENEN